MHIILVHLLSLIVIMISVFLTLIAKSELDKMFRDKKAEIPFHVCNVITIVVLAYCIKFVLMVFIFEERFLVFFEYLILLGITLPIYLYGNHLYNRFQMNNRKYEAIENGKIIVLNEKYLQRKRQLTNPAPDRINKRTGRPSLYFRKSSTCPY